MESERRERAAERAELEEFRKGAAEIAAREAADAMVRQHQLVRTWLGIERRLEEAKVGLLVELWEVGLRLEHEAIWAKVNGLAPAAQEDSSCGWMQSMCCRVNSSSNSSSSILSLSRRWWSLVMVSPKLEPGRSSSSSRRKGRPCLRLHPRPRRMRHRDSSSSGSSRISLGLRW